jgi:hypothetical protein
MKQKSTVVLVIEDIFNLGEVEVEWSASLVKTDTGVGLRVEVPDQVINLPVHNVEEDSFDDCAVAPVKLSNNSAEIFTSETESSSLLEITPTHAWVNWEKKSLVIQFESDK